MRDREYERQVVYGWDTSLGGVSVSVWLSLTVCALPSALPSDILPSDILPTPQLFPSSSSSPSLPTSSLPTPSPKPTPESQNAHALKSNVTILNEREDENSKNRYNCVT